MTRHTKTQDVQADKLRKCYQFERNQAVVYGIPSLDITNEVIRTYNSQAGGSKK